MVTFCAVKEWKYLKRLKFVGILLYIQWEYWIIISKFVRQSFGISSK